MIENLTRVQNLGYDHLIMCMYLVLSIIKAK